MLVTKTTIGLTPMLEVKAALGRHQIHKVTGLVPCLPILGLTLGLMGSPDLVDLKQYCAI